MMKLIRPALMAICLVYLHCANAQTGLNALRQFISQQQSLSGEFTQTTLGKAGQQTGQFALSKPGQFRWAIKKPYEQLLVSDGKTITQWDPDLNQATLRSAAGLFNNTPAALLLGGSNVDKFFTLTDSGSEEGLLWATATSKGSESQFKWIKIGFKDGLPKQLITLDAFGGQSQLQFNALSTAPISQQQFVFTPPKGADVVKM